MQGLLSSFFLSVDSDQSSKGSCSEAANSLLDVLRVSTVTTSVSYFGLLNDLGVSLETLMKGFFTSRKQSILNHKSIDCNMTSHRKTYRIIFHPDNFISFFHFVFEELSQQPLLRVIMRSPSVMIQSEEFVVERTQVSILIIIGENVLFSQTFITMAFKTFSTLINNHNSLIYGTTSFSIFNFIQSILSLAMRNGIQVASTSIPPLHLHQENQPISTSCPSFPLLSIEISNLLQFVNDTYTTIQDMLLVCDKRAQVQDKNDT